ncbi:MAG: hypothetical protein EA422_12595 [Gemmatimonadales bacterium]|nr:MAG: hypothetical protein EA422_12595 [Gemmatimonadales bacterium]
MSRRPSIRIRRALPLAAAGFFVLGGCDYSGLSSLEDDLEITLDIPGVATTVALQLVDQRTGAPVETNALVEVGGRDGGVLFDPLLFESVEATTTSSGVVVLGLDDRRLPSATQPVVFDIFVSAPGFVETTRTVILDRPGLHSGEVGLVNLQSPPPGVTSTVATATASPDGSLLTPIVATTPTEAETGGAASVQIPAGTILRTAGGEPLTGPTTATVAYFNDASLTSLSSFPGGLDAVQIEGGPLGSFITGGFVSITVQDSQGRRAAELSQAADVAIAVASGTVNPLTQAPVRAGDELPIWSLDPRSGVWQAEGVRVAEAVPEALADGRPLPRELTDTGLITRFTTEHLSYFNIDWFSADNCGIADNTVFRFDTHPTEPLRLEIFQRGFWSGRNLATGPAGQEFKPFGFPRDMSDASWRLIRLADRSEVSRGDVAGPLCGATVPLSAPERPSSLIVELQVDVACPSGGRNLFLQPSYPVAYRPVGSPFWTWANIESGRVVLEGLEYGARYEVGLNVKRGNTWSFETRTILLSEDPTGGIMDPGVQFMSGERDGDRLTLWYRISDVRAICDVL